jgi:hypothetical protein
MLTEDATNVTPRLAGWGHLVRTRRRVSHSVSSRARARASCTWCARDTASHQRTLRACHTAHSAFGEAHRAGGSLSTRDGSGVRVLCTPTPSHHAVRTDGSRNGSLLLTLLWWRGFARRPLCLLHVYVLLPAPHSPPHLGKQPSGHKSARGQHTLCCPRSRYRLQRAARASRLGSS